MNVRVDYRMGPKRPLKPNQDVIRALQATAEQTFGSGARVAIISGKGEHGSPRHRQGEAADVQFTDARGQLVRIDDPRVKNLASTAARNGITGFGAGNEYMGNSTFHLDMYPLNKYSKGMSQTWGSTGKQLTKDFVGVSKQNRYTADSKKYDVEPPTAEQQPSYRPNYRSQSRPPQRAYPDYNRPPEQRDYGIAEFLRNTSPNNVLTDYGIQNFLENSTQPQQTAPIRGFSELPEGGFSLTSAFLGPNAVANQQEYIYSQDQGDFLNSYNSVGNFQLEQPEGLDNLLLLFRRLPNGFRTI
jgi:hypothetical protein